MSLKELLTPDEVSKAAMQGWSLCHVFDLESSKWRVQIYGAPRCDLAGQLVVGQARMGDALCIKALRLVQASHQT